MKTGARGVVVLGVVAGLLAVCAGRSEALREIGGTEPMPEMAWPDGCREVANLPTRLGYSAGYNHDFVYRGDTEAFQKALTAFAAIRAPALELHLYDGPHEVSWVKGLVAREPAGGKKVEDSGRVDWTFTVWTPAEWHQIYNSPESYRFMGQNMPVPAPRLDVYVVAAVAGGAPVAAGGIDWARVKVPAGVKVTDVRAAVQGAKRAGPLLHGVVYDIASGKTLGGAKIEARTWKEKAWVTEASATADAAGRFRIEGLAEGQYHVVVSAAGYAPRLAAYGRFDALSTKAMDVELSKAVRVKGSVSDAQGQPLAGVRVQAIAVLGIDGREYAQSEPLAATTDAAGTFNIAVAPTGFARWHCEGPRHVMANPMTLWKLASWRTVVNNELKETGEVPVALQMEVPGLVRCKVASTAGGALVGEWHVAIADAEGGLAQNRYQRSVAVQADGSALFEGLAPGRYFVSEGYSIDLATEVKTVRVGAGQETAVSLAVKPRPVRKPEPAAEEPKPVRPQEAPGEF